MRESTFRRYEKAFLFLARGKCFNNLLSAEPPGSFYFILVNLQCLTRISYGVTTYHDTARGKRPVLRVTVPDFSHLQTNLLAHLSPHTVLQRFPHIQEASYAREHPWRKPWLSDQQDLCTVPIGHTDDTHGSSGRVLHRPALSTLGAGPRHMPHLTKHR